MPQVFPEPSKLLKPIPVSIAYALISGSLLLVGHLAFPFVGAPVWATRMLIAVLTMTAPFVIVMAWALSSGPPVGVRVTRRPGNQSNH